MTVVHPKLVRTLLLVTASAAIVAIGGLQIGSLFDRRPLLPIDYVAFWTAGHLNARGENPYSANNVHTVQRSLGWDDTAIIMWNPPWVLTLVTPFGLLPIERAYGLWVLLHLTLLATSAHLLWLGFGGPKRLWWIPQLIAATFTPSIFLIGSGQLTTFVLFGLAGFAWVSGIGYRVCRVSGKYRESQQTSILRDTRYPTYPIPDKPDNRPLVAGAFAALTAVKPHLLSLFALWLVIGMLHSRVARRVVLGGVVVGLAVSLAALATNPHCWAQYRDALQAPTSAEHHHIADWKPPLIGWWLRQAIPEKPFFVQWLPLAMASLGFAVIMFRNGVALSSPSVRSSSFPMIVAGSLLVSPYGAWMYDLVLLLPLLLTVAVDMARAPSVSGIVTGVLLLTAVNATTLIMMLNRTSSEWYVWVAPVLILGAIAVRRLNAETASVRLETGALQPSPVGA